MEHKAQRNLMRVLRLDADAAIERPALFRVVVTSQNGKVGASDTEQTAIGDRLNCGVEKRRSRAVRIEIDQVKPIRYFRMLIHERNRIATVGAHLAFRVDRRARRVSCTRIRGWVCRLFCSTIPLGILHVFQVSMCIQRLARREIQRKIALHRLDGRLRKIISNNIAQERDLFGVPNRAQACRSERLERGEVVWGVLALLDAWALRLGVLAALLTLTKSLVLFCIEALAPGDNGKRAQVAVEFLHWIEEGCRFGWH